MRKFYLALILCVISVSSFAQWTWQNPLPQGNTLNSVIFTDANTGYAVGESGTIIKTIDGGLNWTVLPTGTSNFLFSVCFANSNIGYAVGAFGKIGRAHV